MPYAVRKRGILIPRNLDRRVRLTDADRLEIHRLYESGLAIRAIAKKFKEKCSRRLIQFVLFPDRQQHAAELFALRSADGRYYDKTRHAKYMKKHMRYKHSIKKQLIYPTH